MLIVNCFVINALLAFLWRHAFCTGIWHLWRNSTVNLPQGHIIHTLLYEQFTKFLDSQHLAPF